jgi:hypothetical protein
MSPTVIDARRRVAPAARFAQPDDHRREDADSDEVNRQRECLHHSSVQLPR